ncbi:response regulator transcription factor [Nodosilinea sp. P-1105]|uniref:response regulator transcription factor n=1 Tax=Nodosilinea sp. P-1105 TaxID=2546229 RepID=UPI001469B54B|nr:response regulator transcription factor [Nodosilinea sp. P-1105]NMF85003.1 response regulator transcription factor [Nodosilinea sp. P-1105]
MSTVLIVDDDQILQMALTRRLKTQGFEVINALSGQEALTLLSRQPADVVVSDVVMPEMSGFEFCHQLRSRPGGDIIPFIFLSSQGDVDNRVKGHLIGADDYLVKPFHAKELIAKVKGAIARSQRLYEAMTQSRPPAPSTPPPLPLTPAEEKVFWEVVQGFTNKQIGEHLFISPRTVQTHLSNMLAKLKLENRSQLVRFAFEQGYQPPKESEA